jgi:hypothetical protein
METPDYGDDDKMECVGSLLVHSHDLQELSDLTRTKVEASSSRPATDTGDFVSNPQLCATVGTLLLPPFDFNDFVHHHHHHHHHATTSVDDDHNATKPTATATTTTTAQPATRNNTDQEQDKSPAASLVRRITNKLQGPAPNDDEAELWAD